jgi:hypothetical protein
MKEHDYWMNRANQDTVNNNLTQEAQINYWALKQDMALAESLKPKLLIDGNQWCCLYGENLQDGVAGFGDTPHAAILEFNKAMYQKL